MKLFLRTVINSIVGLAILGACLFVPAGTLDYWQGWAFFAAFTGSTVLMSLYLALYDPALLERRVKAGPAAETRPIQKILMLLITVSMVALVVFSALDHRFGWSPVPTWVSVLGNVLVVLGLMITLLVLRENSYSAATIKMMEGQKVISSGPYALVRHPMYFGTLIMFLGVPLALDSYWGLLFVLVDIPILMLRIGDEETMLRRELEGYEAYTQKVRSRLLPGLW